MKCADAGRKFGLSGYTCIAPHCDNNVEDQDETSIDCGGECGCLASFEVMEIPSDASFLKVHAISGDGRTIVGVYSQEGILKPYSWIVNEAPKILPLPNDANNAWTSSINYDGKVIVGGADCKSCSAIQRAVRWINRVPELLDQADEEWMTMWDVSDSGDVVSAVLGQTYPVYWQDGVLITEGIGDLRDDNVGMIAPMAISGDGRVFGGNSPTGLAVMWSDTLGVLVPQGGENHLTYISDLNIDGSIAVGEADVEDGRQAFRWTAKSFQLLGDIEGGIVRSEPTSVSADGEIVVGYGTSNRGHEAFIWDSVNEMRLISDELWVRGFELSNNIVLNEAKGVSSDGNAIAGLGTDESDVTFIWRVVLI